MPFFGEAKAAYTLRCVTEPRPGYRKRLMGGPDFLMAREGLFIGMNGRELSPIEVHWSLPPGWSLALIREETGYDPAPLFKKYFSAPVKNAAELLR